jgi:hypothetical protein
MEALAARHVTARDEPVKLIQNKARWFAGLVLIGLLLLWTGTLLAETMRSCSISRPQGRTSGHRALGGMTLIWLTAQLGMKHANAACKLIR